MARHNGKALARAKPSAARPSAIGNPRRIRRKPAARASAIGSSHAIRCEPDAAPSSLNDEKRTFTYLGQRFVCEAGEVTNFRSALEKARGERCHWTRTHWDAKVKRVKKDYVYRHGGHRHGRVITNAAVHDAPAPTHTTTDIPIIDAARAEVSSAPRLDGACPSPAHQSPAATSQPLATTCVTQPLATDAGAWKLTMAPSAEQEVVPLRLLSKGTFGTVYQVRYRNQFFACKVIQRGVDDAEEYHNEVGALIDCRHENIVECLTVIPTRFNAQLFFPMYDSTLTKMIKRAGGKVEPSVGRTIVSNVMKAVAHMHARGFMHRDIKSSNIFV